MTQQVNEWTIGRLLKWTTDYLDDTSDSPRLDAEILLAEARGCQRIELYTAFAEVADEQTRTAFRELVRRRAEGMPVAYLVGRREFYSLSFRVTPDVLIPRPETEFLVIELLDQAKGRQPPSERPFAIADVGTGSGILAICAKTYLAEASVLAIDVSAEALNVARANACDHQLEGQIEFQQSNLFDDVDANRKFDFVISNPPYVSESEYEELPDDVRQHEPSLALLGGATGSEIIEKLGEQAYQRLQEGGQFMTEISPMIEQRVTRSLTEIGYQNLHVVKDLAGHARVVCGTRS